MSKFKVGDRVVFIKDDLGDGTSYNRLLGEAGIITLISNDKPYNLNYHVNFCNIKYDGDFKSCELEHVNITIDESKMEAFL